MKLLLKISYDGSAYCGSQYQPSCPTIQGVLTEKLSEVFGFPCNVTGCSRTDAGVHAVGYVVSVEPRDISLRSDNWCRIPEEKVHRAVNMLLPDDIAVTGAAFVPDGFHPRYDAVAKEYRYVICDSVCPDPFMRNRAYLLKRRLDNSQIGIMNEAARHLVGKRDFSSFMASGSSVSDTVRTLYKLEAERAAEGAVYVTALGDGFLYNMVRILTGTLLDAAFGKISPQDVPEILASRDRSKAGHTAPACGLYLMEVRYAEKIDFKAE